LPQARVVDFDDPLAPDPARSVRALIDLGLTPKQIGRYLGVDPCRVRRLLACDCCTRR
jgi:hypothetical protein